MSKAPIVILEGEWWKSHEVPLVLPYFHALSISHRNIDVSHKTIRSVDDIAYYVSRISKNSGAMLYFACHGEGLHLKPAGERAKISQEKLLEALGKAKEGALSFVHFGCCEMVDPKARRQSHQVVLSATGAKWASGYTKSVDWLQSTFLDLALVSELFVAQHDEDDGRVVKLKSKASAFVKTYSSISRSLGFSALSTFTGGAKLFPGRLRERKK